jgi:S1-C subfamily serine protease
LALSIVAGQDRDAGAGVREGGIPRKALAPERDRDRQEGLEEGTPDLESQPGLRDALPRFRMPQGEWKLGVWAYNTSSGVVITRVAPSSAAAREGLEPGDRIVSVGGYQVGYVGELLYPLGFELRRQADASGQVLLLVQNVRNEELVNLTVELDRPGRVRPLPAERP